MTLRHWEDINTHTHTHRQRRVFKFKLNYSWTDHFRPELSEQTSVAPGLPFYLRTNNMHLCSVSLLIGHIDLFVFPHWWEWFAFLFVLQELREEAPSTSRAIKTTQLDPVSVETRRIDTSGSGTCQESFHYDPQEIPGSPGSPVFNGFFSGTRSYTDGHTEWRQRHETLVNSNGRQDSNVCLINRSFFFDSSLDKTMVFIFSLWICYNFSFRFLFSTN